MTAVLSIDAAWKKKNPSGVAIAVKRDDGWHLIGLYPSYQDFLGQPELKDQIPSASALLPKAEALANAPVQLLSVDMPLSYQPIVERRVSDNAVSKEYGSRGAGTHSPSAERPGKISDNLREEFQSCGYPLITQAIELPGLVEVYPHPALIELTGASYRLEYKEGKISKYWPELPCDEREAKLHEVWNHIKDHLEAEISSVKKFLPDASTLENKEHKAFEDMLDAIVCAWVAIEALEERALPFGDEDSSIWIPRSR